MAQRSAVVMLTAAWVGSALLYDKLTDGLVRISVGIEDTQDILADLQQAVAKL